MNKILPVALAAALASMVGCQNPGSNQQTPVPPATLTAQAAKQITVGATPHGMTSANGFVYNSNQGAASISVIDPATETVLKEIPVPNGTPGYTKAFHDGKHILTLDAKQGNLLVIDTTKHEVVQTIAVGKGPDKVVIDEEDKTVLVSLTDESKAVLLTFDADRTKAPARKEFAVGPVAAAQFKHRSIAYNHDWAVVPNSGENNVTIINVRTGASQNVMDGNSPGPVGIGSASEQAVAALVGNVASNTLTIFALPSFEKTTLSDVGLAPTEMIFDAQLKRGYVTMSGSNDVAVIDYVGKKVVGRVPVGKRPVHIFMAPPMPTASKFTVANDDSETLSHEIWVGNDDGESVSIFDGETLRVKATIMTGKGHHKMAFVGTKAFVSNMNDNNVSVIDRTTIQ